LAHIRHTSFAYRLVVCAVRLVAAIAVLALSAAGAGAGASPAVQLRLDGVPFRPELALTPDERGLGLMHRRRAPKDGMLFVFPRETTGAFWMKNTLVPLTIAFFDSNGRRVRKLSMTPCRSDPCPLYNPRRTYQFALELRATDTRKAARLGPLRELERLARRAS
jgi:uncharacterized membrane protein (UPF0127 family)